MGSFSNYLKHFAFEDFRQKNRLAPLRLLASTSFSQINSLTSDLSSEYHITKIDAFDFLKDLFQHEKFLYLFHHKLSSQEKKTLQFLCRNLEVNQMVFFKLFPSLLKSELVYFEQYQHHLFENYKGQRFGDLPKEKEVEIVANATSSEINTIEGNSAIGKIERELIIQMNLKGRLR